MSDDLDPQSIDADTLERLEALQDDETIDLDSQQRQDAGWVKFYVECPECQTPMARNTLQSEDVASPENERKTKTHIKAVCPDCGAVESLITVYRHTKPIERPIQNDGG